MVALHWTENRSIAMIVELKARGDPTDMVLVADHRWSKP